VLRGTDRFDGARRLSRLADPRPRPQSLLQGIPPQQLDRPRGVRRHRRRLRMANERMAARILKRGLPPVVQPNARVLLLGSFPGEESLRQAQYYAHPRNQFWRLLGDILALPLAELPYSTRLQRLTTLRIRVRDIITH